MGILSECQLRQMSKHRYAVGGYSTLERHVLGPSCSWLVQCLPRWLAPNLITLVGGLAVLVPGVFYITATPTGTCGQEEVSRSFLALAGVGQLLYQILDCLDGKQARRTQTSTPLGEFLDHGIDACAGVVMSLTMASTLCLGEVSLQHASALFATLTLFLMAHWHSHIAGSVHVNYWVDVEEGRFYLAGWLALSSVFPSGRSFYATELTVLGLSFRVADLVFLPPSVFVVVGVIGCMYNCCRLIAHRSPSERFALFSPFIAVLLWMMPSATLCIVSPLFQTQPQLVLACVGLVAVHLIHQLLILNMCKSPFPVFHVVLVLPPLLLCNSVLMVLPEYQLFLTVLIGEVLFTVVWSGLIIGQMLRHFNVAFLTIPTTR